MSQLVLPPTLMFFSDIEVFSPRHMYRAQFQTNQSKRYRDIDDFKNKAVQKWPTWCMWCRWRHHMLWRNKPSDVSRSQSWVFENRSKHFRDITDFKIKDGYSSYFHNWWCHLSHGFSDIEVFSPRRIEPNFWQFGQSIAKIRVIFPKMGAYMFTTVHPVLDVPPASEA